MNTSEIYRASKAIAGRLAAAGHIGDSDHIVSTIKRGFTATEILMALRHELRAISAAKSVAADLRDRAGSLAAQVDLLLNPGAISTLEDVRAAVDGLMARLGVRSHVLLPAYGASDQTGRPHIEQRGSTFSYVISERDREIERRRTDDGEELLCWIFQAISQELAFGFERARRIGSQDPRRIAFAKQREILGSLRAEWSDRISKHHEAILAKHPYDDRASERARRSKELRGSGYSGQDAWREACEEFPLPPKES